MIYVSVFFSGFILTLLLVYPVSWLASRMGAIAKPGGRSIHAKPTPLLGGLALYLSCIVLVVCFLLFHPDLVTLINSWKKLVGLLIGSSVLLVVGIIDDIKPLRVRTKLAGQLTAALLCSLFGHTIMAVNLPFIGTFSLGTFGTFLFVIWVLAITNAINLIDGLDGLASVVCFFAAVGNGLIAISVGNIYIGFFSFLLAGSLVGFLFHNFPPAKIFLGDTGSMLLGFLLSVTVLESGAQKRSTTLMVFAPLMLLAFSLLDVLLSIIRRFLRGKPIFSSDLGHIHHRLISRFNNPRRVLLVVSGFSCFAMLVALGMHFTQRTSAVLFWLIMVSAVLGLFLFVRLLGYFRIERIRYVLYHREGVKFFVSVLGFLRASFAQRKGRIDYLSELDWVCHALKPLRVAVRNENNDVLYCYTREDDSSVEGGRYEESLQVDDFLFEWSCVTESPDPTMCDIRLLWRELFVLFGEKLMAQHPNADTIDTTGLNGAGDHIVPPSHPHETYS